MGSASQHRLRVHLQGAVQGVGFRPFVFRLAEELALPGWVLNSNQGVRIEVEGPDARLREFLHRLPVDAPPRSRITSLEHSFLDPVGFEGFEIRHSDDNGDKTTLVLPDIATCPECLAEIFDPGDRRHRYPFTNCTHCGPRYTIIEALPYDRPHTSMRIFPMCPRCQAEYEDPRDRRFHAQPNACPDCGPRLSLRGRDGAVQATGDDALTAAEDALRDGRILAVQGLGGFHLMVDAEDEEAVRRLRDRKGREEKPLALMVPDLRWAQRLCHICPEEERLLRSPESPIVLLRRRDDADLAVNIAPGNPDLGLMLPYTPLHHLLLRDLGRPVVATSGNRSDEPICTDADEALERLGDIADLWLVHDRPIVRHVDDSIVRMVAGRELVLRRARGYAPLPVPLGRDAPTILALGAHLKNTIVATQGDRAFVSQHIGDLETGPALDAFHDVIDSLTGLYGLEPQVVACDLHPDYASTRHAQTTGLPLKAVQHHHAHVLSCMADNDLDGPVLGVSWDGTGYGPDGTVWGGEFLRVDGTGFERVAHLRTFRLPGGDTAIRQPRRSALGVLHELMGEDCLDMDSPAVEAFEPEEAKLLRYALSRGLNAPVTSSAGRLFDAVASLTGVRQRSSFEGQAAMALEATLDGMGSREHYPIRIDDGDAGSGGPAVINWGPMVQGILDDLSIGTLTPLIAARFHNTLVEAIVAVAHRTGLEKVVLTGGCFQNRYLSERTIERLREEGFRPYWHQRIPPNDGGIAVGQAVAAAQWNPGGP